MARRNVVALVPMRLESERLPGKNLKPLHGEPLCRYLLTTLISVPRIECVYVYCSDDRVRELLPPGVAFLRRPAWLDGDRVKGLEIYTEFAKSVDARVYLLAHVTSPFLRAETFIKGLAAVLDGDHDSALTVRREQTFAWHRGAPLNYALDDVPRTQDLEPLLVETSGFYIFKREELLERGRRVGRRPAFIEVDHDEALDIDTPGDFAFAERIAAGRRESDTTSATAGPIPARRRQPPQLGLVRWRHRAENVRRCLQVVASTPYRVAVTRRMRRERAIASPGGIEEFDSVELGGVRQSVLLRGHDRENPLLLFLHGGVDEPAYFSYHRFGHHTGLERFFTIVYWERRGVGRSRGRGIPPETFTLDQTVADAAELIEQLLARFERRKLVLLGQSWASALAMLVAARRPDLLHAVAGSGQVVCSLDDRRLNYVLCRAHAVEVGHRRAVAALDAIGPPPYDFARSLVYDRWTDWYWRSRANLSKRPLGGILPRLHNLARCGLPEKWMSPCYSLIDLAAIALHPKPHASRLGERGFDIELIRQAPRIEVPVYFFHGRSDLICPPETLMPYYERLEAPAGKEIVWFEGAGHAPYLGQPEPFRDAAVSRLLGRGADDRSLAADGQSATGSS